MGISAFFKDMANMAMWAYDQAGDYMQRGASVSDHEDYKYYAAVNAFEELSIAMDYFFDKEKADLEEIVKNTSKKIDDVADTDIETYQEDKEKIKEVENQLKNFLKLANEFLTSAAEKKAEVSAEFKRLVRNAESDLWAIEDARKKVDPLLEKSEAVKNFKDTMYAPKDMKEFTELEKNLEELEKRAKELEVSSIDEIESEILGYDKGEIENLEAELNSSLEGKEEAETGKVNTKAKTSREEQARVVSAQEKSGVVSEGSNDSDPDNKTEDSTKPEEEKTEEAKANVKADYQQTAEANKEENIEAAQTEAAQQEEFANDMDELVKKMQKEDKNLHINSKEFKNMRDSLYRLVELTKQIKEEMGDNQSLTLEQQKQLHQSIAQLQQSTRAYMEAKGMGKQLTGLGKRRMELASSIDEYIFSISKNAREKLGNLEKSESLRIATEQKEQEIKAAREKVQNEINELGKVSRFPKTLYKLEKAKGLLDLPDANENIKLFKEEFKKLNETLRSCKDPEIVKMELRRYNSISFRANRGISKIFTKDQSAVFYSAFNIGNQEMTEVAAADKKENYKYDYKERRSYLEGRYKAYESAFKQLEQLDDLPIKTKEFLKEYNTYFNETDPDKLTPEYRRYRFEKLRSFAATCGGALMDYKKHTDVKLITNEFPQGLTIKEFGTELLHKFCEHMLNADRLYTDKGYYEDTALVGTKRIFQDYVDRYGSVIEQLEKNNDKLAATMQLIRNAVAAEKPDNTTVRALMEYELYETLYKLKPGEIKVEGVPDNERKKYIEIIASQGRDCGYAVNKRVTGKAYMANRMVTTQLLANRIKAIKDSTTLNAGAFEKMLINNAEKFIAVGEEIAKNDNTPYYKNKAEFVDQITNDFYKNVLEEREGKITLKEAEKRWNKIFDAIEKAGYSFNEKDPLKNIIPSLRNEIYSEKNNATERRKAFDIAEKDKKLDESYKHKGFKNSVITVNRLLKNHNIDIEQSKEYKDLMDKLNKRTRDPEDFLREMISFEKMLFKLEKENEEIRELNGIVTFRKGFEKMYIEGIKGAAPNVTGFISQKNFMEIMGYSTDTMGNNNKYVNELHKPETQEYVNKLVDNLNLKGSSEIISKIRKGEMPTHADKVALCKIVARAKLSKKFLDGYEKIKFGEDKEHYINARKVLFNKIFEDLDKYVENNVSRETSLFDAENNLYEDWYKAQKEMNLQKEKEKENEYNPTRKQRWRFDNILYKKREIDDKHGYRFYPKYTGKDAIENTFNRAYDYAASAKIPEKSFLDKKTMVDIVAADSLAEGAIRDYTKNYLREKGKNIANAYTVYVMSSIKTYNETEEGKKNPLGQDFLREALAGENIMRKRDTAQFKKIFNEDEKHYFCVNLRKKYNLDVMYPYATEKARDMLLEEESLVSPQSAQLANLLRENKAGIQLSDNHKALLNIMSRATSATPESIDIFRRLDVRESWSNSRIKQDYYNLGLGQLAVKHIDTLNKMTVEERKEFIESGKIKEMEASFEKMQSYMEKNMPKYMTHNGEGVDTSGIVGLKFVSVTVRNNLADEFLNHEKQLNEKTKVISDKEKEDTAIIQEIDEEEFEK